MKIKTGSVINAGTLLSLVPVIYLALAGLQHVAVGDSLRGWLVAASSIGLAAALALGMGYVGAEGLARVGLSPVQLRRAMLGMWGVAFLVIPAMVTAAHASGAASMYDRLGAGAYALVWAAVMAAELLVVAAMLADRLKALEGGEQAQQAEELEWLRAKVAEAEEDREEAQRDLSGAVSEIARLKKDLDAQAGSVALVRDAMTAVANRLGNVTEERDAARRQAEELQAEVDRLTLATVGDGVRRVLEAITSRNEWSTVADLEAATGIGGSGVRATLKNGVERGVISRRPAEGDGPARWEYGLPAWAATSDAAEVAA